MKPPFRQAQHFEQQAVFLQQVQERQILQAPPHRLYDPDNGGTTRATSSYPLMGSKSYPYEGGMRVPAAVRWPARTRTCNVESAL